MRLPARDYRKKPQFLSFLADCRPLLWQQKNKAPYFYVFKWRTKKEKKEQNISIDNSLPLRFLSLVLFVLLPLPITVVFFSLPCFDAFQNTFFFLETKKFYFVGDLFTSLRATFAARLNLALWFFLYLRFFLSLSEEGDAKTNKSAVLFLFFSLQWNLQSILGKNSVTFQVKIFSPFLVLFLEFFWFARTHLHNKITKMKGVEWQISAL